GKYRGLTMATFGLVHGAWHTALAFGRLSVGVHCAYNDIMTAAKAERLHLRIDAEQKALLEAASAASGERVSAFGLAAATEAAANVLADRRVFVLDEESWQAFDDALTRPAADVPGLRDLLHSSTVLDDPTAGGAR